MISVFGTSPLRVNRSAPDFTAVDAIEALRPRGELIALAILLACYCFTSILGTSELWTAMNVAGPIALTAILGWTAYHMIERNFLVLWAPLFWFRVACGTYFGFGALVPHIVNDKTLTRILAYYHFSETTNLKVNLICCLGIFLTLLISYGTLRVQKTQVAAVPSRRYPKGSDQRLKFAILFLCLGGAVRYGLVVPYTFGLTNYILPGSIGSLGQFYYAGLYLFVSYAVARNRNLLTIAGVLIAVEVFVALASFSKTDLLLVLVFSFLGVLSARVTKTKVIVGALIILSSYSTFQPIVGYGREVIAWKYGSIEGATIGERWSIIQNYFSGGQEIVDTEEQGGLLRLSYLNVNAYVVDRYDAGIQGDTLYNAFTVLIPRVLWKDKPIISQLGEDLNYEMLGKRGSSIGIGYFAEAYWNMGWAGVPLFATIIALILSVFSRFSITRMAQKEWIFLPVVFLGVFIGLRVDGNIVSDLIGQSWMALVLGFSLSGATMVMRGTISKLRVRPVFSQRHNWT